MRSAGAVGFSNGDHAYASSGALMRALLYTKEFGGIIMSHALDPDLSGKGFGSRESDDHSYRTEIATGFGGNESDQEGDRYCHIHRRGHSFLPYILWKEC